MGAKAQPITTQPWAYWLPESRILILQICPSSIPLQTSI